MTLPSTDLLYLRDDERVLFEDVYRRVFARTTSEDPPTPYENNVYRLLTRLIEARKEIARLQIASGEIIQRAGDEVA